MNIQWSKTASSTNDVGRSGQVHAKKMKLDHQLTSYTRIISRFLNDLHISCDIIKVLEENMGSKMSEIPQSNIFAEISLRAKEIKEKVNICDYIKLKICMAKETLMKV